MERLRWGPLLLALLLTSGCAVPEEPEDPEGEEALTASQVEDAARPLTEEEVLNAYARAESLYAWFDRTPLPDSGETETVDGRTYRRVEAKGLETVEDLRISLRSVFSQDLTDRLLEEGTEGGLRYRDIGGALYVAGWGREASPGRGGVSLEVEEAGPGAYSVNAAVDLLAEDGVTVTGLECWSFPYVYEDGRWVFTEFRLVR